MSYEENLTHEWEKKLFTLILLEDNEDKIKKVIHVMHERLSMVYTYENLKRGSYAWVIDNTGVCYRIYREKEQYYRTILGDNESRLLASILYLSVIKPRIEMPPALTADSPVKSLWDFLEKEK